MRALLCHCKIFRTTITALATRPIHIIPETIDNVTNAYRDCVGVLLTVEREDTQLAVPSLVGDIVRMAAEVGATTVVLLPFAHLSNNLAHSTHALSILDSLQHALKDTTTMDAFRVHFGSHKALLLDIYGHPGNVRYREY